MGDLSSVCLIQPDLIEKVGKGDPGAFEEFYDQTCGVIFSLAHRMLGNQDEAILFFQDVYVEIRKRAQEFRPDKGPAVPWVMDVARQKGIRHLRSREWVPTLDAEGEKDCELASSLPSMFTPDESSSLKEIREVLKNVVSQLPKDQADVLDLAYYEGLTLAEIAVRLHEPVGEVKTKIRLALYKVKASIHSSWEQE